MSGNQTTLFGGGSRYITNPKHLSAFAAAGSVINVKTSATTLQTTAAAAAFTALALRGAQASVSVADTYVTVANLTGAGFMFNCISPTHDTLSFTPTFRITVDGVVYTLAPSTTFVNLYRMVLGPVTSGLPSISGISTIGSDIPGVNSPTDLGFQTAMVGGVPTATGNISIPTPEQILAFQMQCLRFESSLLVEMKTSLLGSTSINKQCAVTYRLDL